MLSFLVRCHLLLSDKNFEDYSNGNHRITVQILHVDCINYDLVSLGLGTFSCLSIIVRLQDGYYLLFWTM